MIERGQNGRWVSLPPEAQGGNSRALRRLASRLNKTHGVSQNAAQALFVDWKCEFKNPPINPVDYAAYKRDDRLVNKARRGARSGRPVSEGCLRFLVGLQALPYNPAICRVPFAIPG